MKIINVLFEVKDVGNLFQIDCFVPLNAYFIHGKHSENEIGKICYGDTELRFHGIGEMPKYTKGNGWEWTKPDDGSL
jgi:hypothetical protein